MSRDHSNEPRKRWPLPLLVCVVVGLLCRVSILVAVGDPLGSGGTLGEDTDAYRVIAENLRQRGVYARGPLDRPATPTAFRPPLYPLLLRTLSCSDRVTNLTVAILHVVLGLGTIIATYFLARQWRLPTWWASGSAMLVAVDPLLLHQSTYVMTETIATLLAVTATLALGRLGSKTTMTNAIVVGVTLGLTALCRPTFLVWIAFATLAIIVMQTNWRRGIIMAVVVSACVVLMLAPWTIRNQRQLGKPVFATTHGGYTFLLANNSHFYDFLRDPAERTVWDAEELHATRLANDPIELAKFPDEHREVVQDRLCYQEAVATIRSRPGDFVWSCGVRIVRFWRPLPHQLASDESTTRRTLRYAVCAWYVFVLGFAAIGLMSQRNRLFASPLLWSLLLIVSLTLVHTFFWSNIRMRSPTMPMVCCLAAVGLQITTQWRRRRVLSHR